MLRFFKVLSEDISSNNLYQQIATKVKDPEFEVTFRKVCNDLNNLNCDALFSLLKTKFSPENATKSGRRVIIVNEKNDRHSKGNGFESILPLLLIAGLGNRNRNKINPSLYELPADSDNSFDISAFLAAQQQQPYQKIIDYSYPAPPYYLLPNTNFTNSFPFPFGRR